MSAKSDGAAAKKKVEVFSEDEMAAMKEHAKEQKAAAKRQSKADEENAVLEKIAEMPKDERGMALRLHNLIKANAPGLSPKLWYGMPAYARDGKVVCFFQSAAKFKSRYATLGFNDEARLDDGALWPTAYALKELTPAVEKQIAELMKRAVS